MCNKLTSIDLQQQYNVKARRNQLNLLITVRYHRTEFGSNPV